MAESTTRAWLRRFSIAMVWLIPLIVIASLALQFIYWGLGLNVLGENFLVITEQAPREGARLFGFLVGVPALAAWFYALWRLWRLFSKFRRELFIDKAAALDLRAYSTFAIVAVILDIATSGARRWAMGVFDNAPLWTHININTEHLTLVFSALIFLVVSFVLIEANRYKTETEQYL